MNEIWPTIQQSVIQRLVQQGTQSRGTGARQRNAVNTKPACLSGMQQTRVASLSQGHNNGNITSNPVDNERDRLPEREREEDSGHNGYVMNCIHKNGPFPLNEIVRPVFVNNYYAGEPWIPLTNKKFIKLDECGISSENSMKNLQSQCINPKSVETLWNSLRMPISVGKNIGTAILPDNLQGQGQKRGFHSKFIEPS